jgi:DNA-binding transcriptional LysR family regulator
MELRQLRYFVTLAEELHFGRAAAREHMAQSAVSQQLQRLERELGVRLIERSTHHVRLTPGGRAFLPEARRALAQVQRAGAAAQRAAVTAPTVRVGIVDASYDSMPSILRHAQERHPDLVIHQIEAGVPQQCQELLDGRLDVGLGRACLAPPQIASTLVRLDPLGVLVPEGHRFTASAGVPVASLADERLLFAPEERAPEFNEFVVELCRSAGFTPDVHHGTVQSIKAGLDLVLQGRCLVCAPASCFSTIPAIEWRELVDPVSVYPWSVLWRAGDDSEPVNAIVACARRLSHKLGWLRPYGRTPATPSDEFR